MNSSNSFRTRNQLLLVVCLALLLATPARSELWQTRPAQQSSSAARKSKFEQTVPFELVNNHVILKVSINNSRPLSFVLDTGDQFAIVNLETARALGLKLRGEVRVAGAGAAVSTGAYVDGASFKISGLEGFSQPIVLALPLDPLASRLGRDFDGIIGSDFIQQSVLELDYEAHVLKLHDKTTFKYLGPGQKVPIELVHGHPILVAEVSPLNSNPTRGRFVLDIGSGLALALYSPFVRDLKLLNNGHTIRALGGVGTGGETIGRMGRVDELRIGSYVIRNPQTLFSEDKAGALASSQLAGNIGARVASRFRLFFDYDQKLIIFEPNSNFKNAVDPAMSGASLVAEGPDYRTYRIREVLEDSPAAQAGLQKDDVIVAIDGRVANEFELSTLNELLEKVTAYKLTIRRGTKVFDVMLTPRYLV